jgi:hypothetical protein
MATDRREGLFCHEYMAGADRNNPKIAAPSEVLAQTDRTDVP